MVYKYLACLVAVGDLVRLQVCLLGWRTWAEGLRVEGFRWRA
jgi:hypothetical protein